MKRERNYKTDPRSRNAKCDDTGFNCPESPESTESAVCINTHTWLIDPAHHTTEVHPPNGAQLFKAVHYYAQPEFGWKIGKIEKAKEEDDSGF